MAERNVSRRAARRRSIEPGRTQALGEIVNGSIADGVVASDRTGIDLSDRDARCHGAPRHDGNVRWLARRRIHPEAIRPSPVPMGCGPSGSSSSAVIVGGS
jgi:hypothetical protein